MTKRNKMTKIEFTKMVAAGNDFVIVDIKNQKSKIKNLNDLAKKICDRRYGAGADGVLLIEDSKKADFRMRIFNPDGTEVEMCGNGIRCAAMFYEHQASSIKHRKLKIETKAGISEAEIKGDNVKVKMTDPKDLRLNFKLKLHGRVFTAHFINTGVPHVVMFVNNLYKAPVLEWGRQIRCDGQFKPKGANANFVRVMAKDKIAVRTYERGVEAETLACGTGSAASAVITKVLDAMNEGRRMRDEGRGTWDAGRGTRDEGRGTRDEGRGTRDERRKCKVDVVTKSKEVLKVSFDIKDNKISNVYMQGPARKVYEGQMKMSLTERSDRKRHI